MRILTIFILILWNHSYSQPSKETDELILDNYWFSSVSSDQNSILKSLIVSVVAEQREYSIVIKDSNNQVNRFMYKLEINIDKSSDGFEISVLLRNTKSKKVYRNYTAKEVPPVDLLLQTEYVLRLIFELQNTAKFKEIEKQIQKRANTLKQKTLNKRGSNSLKEPPSKQKIDFRKRIMDIKVDIPLKISQAKEKKEAEEDTEKKKLIKKNAAIQMAKRKKTESLKEKQEISNSAPWKNEYSLAFGYSSSNIEVMDSRVGIETLQVRNEISFVEVGGDIITTTPFAKMMKLKTKLLFHKVLTEDEVPLDDYLEYSFLVGYVAAQFDIYIGLNKDTIVFGSVPTIGGGIQPSVVDNYNFEVDFTYSLRPYSARFEFRTLLVSQNKSLHNIETEQAALMDIKLSIGRQIVELSNNLGVSVSLFKRSYSNNKDIEVGSIGYSFGTYYAF